MCSLCGKSPAEDGGASNTSVREDDNFKLLKIIQIERKKFPS